MNILEIMDVNSLNTSDRITFGQIDITSIKFYKPKNRLVLYLNSNTPVSFDNFLKIKKALRKKLLVDVKLYIETQALRYDLNTISKYIDYITKSNKRLNIFKNVLFKYDEEKNNIEFLFDRIVEEKEKYCSFYIGKLEEYGFKNISIDITSNYTNSIPKEKVVIKSNDNNNNYVNNYKKNKRIKYSEYTNISLKHLEYSEENHVKFIGKILSINNTVSRTTGRRIFTYLVTDNEGGIYVKLFENKKDDPKMFDDIKVGNTYQFYGDLSIDKFRKELSFNSRKMEPIEDKKIIDDSIDKRVELHLHTTMSEMDGVCSVEDVVEHAFNLGHKGVAICDHGSVQSFAKAHKKAKSLLKNNDRSFKIVYGCEMYMTDKDLSIVQNANNENLIDQTYVIFDVETTGLSSHFDRIIEFGAVKIKNYEVIDKLQMFINPHMEISNFISLKTNITNEMVEDKPTFEEVSDKILDFMKDSVLVAHNADFDIGFINESLKRINKKPLDNPIVDTLDLARAIHSDRRAYRLGNIARLYKIVYDEDVAHRADYDAKVLSDIFIRMLSDVSRKGVKTLNELQKLQDEDAFAKNRATHVVVLAKNQQGIKDLYELVTISNTKSLAVFGKGGEEFLSEPRIFKEDLNKRRENILLGSACLNGEVFECAANKDQKSLEEAISFYDYIEIQPLNNYSNLIVTDSIRDENRLKDIIKRIIDTSVKLNKLIVATGDVHYLLPEQKKFRDVYINSQGVGGVRHPLYIRNKELRRKTVNPDQHFRTTNEMLECFEWLEDSKLSRMIVIDNTNIIFDMIDYVLPVPEGTFPPTVEGSSNKLKEICYENAHRIYGDKLPEIVDNRLKKELDSIISNGFAVVYYISHLLVKKSNDDGYLVGSRGSVGSSFVATMSNITEVNPLVPHYICPHCKYSEFITDGSVASGYDLEEKSCPNCNNTMYGEGHNIPFETFLGFQGEKVPDIDLNFSNEYQSRAHNFTKDVFGEDHVYRAGTIGTVADKTAYGYVSGYLEEMGLEHVNEATKEYLASGCIGIKRTTGQHPGGIIVIPQDMDTSDFTPIQFPANDKNSDWKTTHFDFHDIHDNVLKFDILGHLDPTAMRLLYNISNIDPTTIPMNDKRVLSLFSSSDELHADTRIYEEKTGAMGLPEFGTKITRRVLEESKPTKFSELVIISGLTHGTDVWANNAQNLIQQGIPLDEVIGCRDDIMTYLIEQKLEPITAFNIMESVRKGRGLTLEWEKVMKEHGVPDWYIDSCKKIKYMFPKAHACAYVIMALRVAWFKVYHPEYFYIQYFTLRCDAYEIETMSKGVLAVKKRINDINSRLYSNDEKRATNKERALLDTLDMTIELYARGYKITNIDIYKSKATEFSLDKDNPKNIIPSFITVDGLGVAAAKSIEEARKDGDFLSKEDLIRRTLLSNKLVEKLDNLGCLNDLPDTNQMSLFG